VAGLMIPAIVACGAGASVALLGVLTWQLLQHWIPIPVALFDYGSLRVGVLRHLLHSPAMTRDACTRDVPAEILLRNHATRVVH
jgi:hypothetical protein